MLHYQKLFEDIIRVLFNKHLFEETSAIERKKDDFASQLPFGKELFFELVMIDFITGQVDRHYDNFLLQITPTGVHEKMLSKKPPPRVAIHVDRLLKQSQEEGKDPVYLVAIDNGAGYTKGHTGGIVEGRYQYYYAELEVASLPLHTLVDTTVRKDRIEKLNSVITLKDTSNGLVGKFLDVSMKEDFAIFDAKTQKLFRQEIINLAKDSSYSTKDGRIQKMPSKEKAMSAFMKKFQTQLGAVVSTQKEKDKMALRFFKTVQQVLGMKERAAVLKHFLQPPEGYKDQFTVKKLAKIKRAQDFAHFWESYYRITNE